METLIERSGLFCYTKIHYFLFSKTGFTKGCMEKAAEMGNVSLVKYEDIIDADSSVPVNLACLLLYEGNII